MAGRDANALGPQPFGVLGLVPGDEPAGRGDDPVPRQRPVAAGAITAPRRGRPPAGRPSPPPGRSWPPARRNPLHQRARRDARTGSAASRPGSRLGRRRPSHGHPIRRTSRDRIRARARRAGAVPLTTLMLRAPAPDRVLLPSGGRWRRPAHAQVLPPPARVRRRRRRARSERSEVVRGRRAAAGRDPRRHDRAPHSLPGAALVVSRRRAARRSRPAPGGGPGALRLRARAHPRQGGAMGGDRRPGRRADRAPPRHRRDHDHLAAAVGAPDRRRRRRRHLGGPGWPTCATRGSPIRIAATTAAACAPSAPSSARWPAPSPAGRARSWPSPTRSPRSCGELDPGAAAKTHVIGHGVDLSDFDGLRYAAGGPVHDRAHRRVLRPAHARARS